MKKLKYYKKLVKKYSNRIEYISTGSSTFRITDYNIYSIESNRIKRFAKDLGYTVIMIRLRILNRNRTMFLYNDKHLILPVVSTTNDKCTTIKLYKITEGEFDIKAELYKMYYGYLTTNSMFKTPIILD